MNKLFLAVLCGACALTVAIVPATGSATGHAHAAKKCKKAKHAAVAKKKCKKKKPVVTVPPATVPAAPLDTDGDGAPDTSDNCVSMSNADQSDADGDGKGDVCDACPVTANPGTDVCPPALDYMNVSSPLCVGTNPEAGSVVLTAPATVDTHVSLVSSHPEIATVPLAGEVVVTAGQTLASFDITGLQTGSVDITASLDGQQAMESRNVESCP